MVLQGAGYAESSLASNRTCKSYFVRVVQGGVMGRELE